MMNGAGHPALWLNLLSLSVGATLGAWSRWGLSLWLNPGPGRFAWGTFSANLIGAYLIGLALAYTISNPDWSPTIRLLFVTGFLGAPTTFSTFSAETVTYLESGRLGLALIYVSASLAGSLALTALGWLTLHSLKG